MSRLTGLQLEIGLIHQTNKIRIVLVFFLALVCWLSAESGGSPAVLWGAPSLAALGSIWSYFLLRWDVLLIRRVLPLAVALLVLFDVLWLFLFVVGTGGFASPFWPLLFFPLIFSAVFFGRSSLALPLTAILIAIINVGLAGASQLAGAEITMQLIARLLEIFALAWLTWALAETIHREREANRRIVNHLVEGVLMVDATGMALLANPRLAGLCGLSVEDILGVDLLHPRDKPGYAVLYQVAADLPARPTHPVTSDVSLEGVQATDLRCYTVPCQEGGERPLGWVVLVYDVSDIRAQARAKEEGLEVLAHELRSPLSALRALAVVLSEMADEMSPEQRSRTLSIIDQETGRLARMASDLLEIAQIETGALALSLGPVVPGDLIARVADVFSVRAEDLDVELRREVEPGLPLLYGDSDRLVQILTCLVNNALKHTPAGGRVTMGAVAAGDYVKLCVSDTGPGITTDAHELIFEKFGQVAQGGDRGAFTGVGLGLYIARLLARRHGGDLVVDSESGEGATFSLILPIAAAGEQRPDLEMPEKVDARSLETVPGVGVVSGGHHT